MADKPSKSLVIYGDGCASLVSPSHSNLHSFASRASYGFLSLRDPPPNDTENDRVIRELAQLLDAYDSCISMTEKHGESDAVVNQKELLLPNLSERSLASNHGFTVFRLDELIKKTDSSDEFIQDAYPTKRCYIFKDVLQVLINAEVLKLRQEQKKVTTNIMYIQFSRDLPLTQPEWFSSQKEN